jgi:ubiquinone/menaquinone biosynthesis C-methylase UbiE
MVRSKRWLVPVLGAATALAWSTYRRRDLGRLLENLRRYSAPSATLYDAVTARLITGFLTRVARDLAKLAPQARVLEVGSGPGRLATTLAEVAPDIRVTGIDIAPDMVERATALAVSSEVADRVEFLVGDVASLPFPDTSFDVVVSTFSAHHWPDPAKGLAEIYRVLRPGGMAWVYDLADWITAFERHGPNVAELAADSPFGNHGACTHSITTKVGPIPLIYRADFRRKQPSYPPRRGQNSIV